MNNTSINIIPKPRSIKTNSSSLDLNSINGIKIENNTKYERYIAGLFKSYLEPLKTLKIEKSIGYFVFKVKRFRRKHRIMLYFKKINSVLF